MSDYKEQNFLEYVLHSLVKQPEDVKIERTIDEMGVLYTVRVAQEDVPQVIGKGGQMIKAIRLLLKTVGYVNKVRANVKVDTPEITKNPTTN